MRDPKDLFGEHARTAPAGERYARPSGPLRLVVVDAHGATVHALPERGEVTLGRSSQCDVQLADPAISRVHAVLELGPPVRIRRLDHGNGVRVRDRLLAPGAADEVALDEPVALGPVTIVVQAGARAVATPARADDEPLVAIEPAMRALVELIERSARSAISVLLLGETGVGKDVVANAIHRASPRAARPFVGLNCAALAPSLLESELFGHEKGAFTGAAQARPGLLESADGGTVFLDEVGEMPLEMQARLLRVLESREVLRVGGTRPRSFDARFVAATNRDLAGDITRGAFRRDLYFRLAGMTLTIPPLRERPREIETLARRFARGAAAALGVAEPPIGATALDALRAYAWPGNVRELRNVVERALVINGGAAIALEHLPPEVRADVASRAAPTTRMAERVTLPPMALRADLEAVERQRILDALEKCAGNQTRAAELLGIPRRTLTRRLEQYQLPRPRGR